MSPLVSVVIPTAARPHLLPRAVQSALDGMQPGETEVIVVPNGPDQSWKDSLSRFNEHPALKILPVAEANANIARNHGLRAAAGKYLRFLDDDDFLYPDPCRSQYELLERSGADICSGGVDYLDPDGRAYWRTLQSDTDDFILAMLSPLRCALPVMHVFRRSRLDGLVWRETQPFLQDVQWLFDICQHAEQQWVKVREPVGAWFHHRGVRISGDLPIHEKQRQVARMLTETIEKLEIAGRMTPARRQAAGAGLWRCIHTAFYLKPAYWMRFAAKVMESFPEARPDIGLYRLPAAHGINPILVETIMLPKRWLNHLLRIAMDEPQFGHHRQSSPAAAGRSGNRTR